MTVLVTGGMGFIGLHTVKSLLDAGEMVVATWNRSYRVPDAWKDEVGKRVLVERVDVTSEFELLDVVKKHRVDGIIHLAMPGIGAAPPVQDYITNMRGLIDVLEAARLFDMRRLTFASSSTLYAGLKQGPFREDVPVPLDSRNATEAYKKACETLLLHYADRTGLSVTALRPRGVYGPMYYSMVNLPSRLCHAAAKGTRPQYGPGGPPFENDTNDFTYVTDCADALTLLHRAESLKHRVYNVGGGRAASVREIVDIVRKSAPRAEIETRPGAGPGGDSPDNYLELSRLKEEFGWTPRYPVERGIPAYIDWLKDHPQ